MGLKGSSERIIYDRGEAPRPIYKGFSTLLVLGASSSLFCSRILKGETRGVKIRGLGFAAIFFRELFFFESSDHILSRIRVQ